MCSYDPYKSDPENKEFYISVTTNMFRNKTGIVHELTHAYEDYNRYINGVKTLKDIIDKTYTNFTNNLSNKKAEIRLFSTIKYFCSNQERNAYFAQLTPTIRQIIKNKNYTRNNFNYISFIHELLETDIWKYIFNAGELIININDYENKNDIIKYYNILCNTSKTFNQISHDLQKLWTKFKNKFEVLVPKIVNEELPK
jgi:hypothetical protein